MTSFKRETYHVGGADVISYELTDAYAHTIQLDPQQAMDLLTWLDDLRGQIIRDMHPHGFMPVGLTIWKYKPQLYYHNRKAVVVSRW